MAVAIVYLICGIASLIILMLMDYSGGEFSAFVKAYEVLHSGNPTEIRGMVLRGLLVILLWPIILYRKIFSGITKSFTRKVK